MTRAESAVGAKPDFLIIGSAKCGTTTLYDDLAQLQGLHLPSDKEPSILTRYQDVEQLRKEYRVHFEGASEDQLCGDGSTNYTKIPIYEGVADNAYRLCGQDLKLIMILRDPVQRIYSHLRHNIAVRRISADEIDRVVLADPIYVAVSNYAMQMRPWVEIFGADRLHCVSFLDYRHNRANTVHEIGKFLGVNTGGLDLVSEAVKNKSSELRYTSRGLGKILETSVYRRYIRRLFPERIRDCYRNFLLPRAKVPNFRLSEAVEQELKDRLRNVECDVESLLGKRIRIYES